MTYYRYYDERSIRGNCNAIVTTRGDTRAVHQRSKIAMSCSKGEPPRENYLHGYFIIRNYRSLACFEREPKSLRGIFEIKMPRYGHRPLKLPTILKAPTVSTLLRDILRNILQQQLVNVSGILIVIATFRRRRKWSSKRRRVLEHVKGFL